MIVKRRVAWLPAWRVIPARYAEEKVFEKIAAPGDLAALNELEQLTNDRVRMEREEIPSFAPADRAKGPGSEFIMAAFANKSAGGSRFSDNSHGVCYVAKELETAVAETKHKREQFMIQTKEPAMQLQMRALQLDLDGHLHDLRGQQKDLPRIYKSDDYTESQALARTLHAEGSEGIAYDSVRHTEGQCAAVFRPASLGNCRSGKAMVYEWNGTEIEHVYELNEYRG